MQRTPECRATNSPSCCALCHTRTDRHTQSGISLNATHKAMELLRAEVLADDLDDIADDYHDSVVVSRELQSLFQAGLNISKLQEKRGLRNEKRTREAAHAIRAGVQQ